MDSVASVTLLIVIYYLLASLMLIPRSTSHSSDVLLCLSGLLFMWVNLRQVSMWIEELNREVANLSNWNLLWSEVLHRLPAEFFVNERGEVMIASEMARKLILSLWMDSPTGLLPRNQSAMPCCFAFMRKHL